MDFTEIVGFLITMAAILYMFIKRAKDVRKSPSTPEDSAHEEEQEQAEILKDFLKSLEVDMDESQDFKSLPKPKTAKPEPPPRIPHEAKPKLKPAYKRDSFDEEFKFRSDLDDLQMKTNIEERKLKLSIKNKYEGDYGEHLLSAEFRGEKKPQLIGYKNASHIKSLIRSLPSKKDIVLLHEILEKPKGFKF